MSDTISISIKELETLLESAKKVKDLKKEDATNIILIQVLKKSKFVGESDELVFYLENSFAECDNHLITINKPLKF